LVQRKTQTSKYWQEQFVVDTDDIEYLYNLLLESNQPRSIDSLALAVVQRHCQLEELAIRTELQRGALYQPKDSYQIGEQLVFPRLDYAAATIVGRRPGYNPQYGEFSVIQVEFEGDGDVREFVTDFPHSHSLNLDEGQSLAEAEGLASPQELYDLYQEHIHVTLEEALEDNDEFINFRGQWFLKGLLAPIHDGHLNIAEAAIDISNNPLPVGALLKDLDLPADIPAETQAISLNFALHADERFENVGPKGQILWYLRRLAPPQAFQMPLQLEAPKLPFDMDRFDNELRRLVGEIDDEATDSAHIQPPISDAETVVVTLNYPHRRVGTLPLTPKTKPFFPEADEHHVRITFIDKRSGKQFPGWVVSKSQYVFGLDQWYTQNQLPVGAYITLISAGDPLTVVVDYQPVRLRREWVRVAVVQDGRLSFQLLKQPITCEYDDLMVVGINDWATIDALWNNVGGSQKPLFTLLRQIFPELAKLNPQGAVHAKTLYSSVNVVRRCPPGPIFYELSTRACFVPMGHGYWTYDSSIAP
jgi:DNA-binding phage protein